MPLNQFTKKILALRANTIKACNFGEAQLTSEQVKNICDALLLNKSLKKLSMPSNGLTDANVLPIFSVLKCHPTLAAIDLSYNHLTVQCLSALSELVKKNQHIKKIDLTSNNINQTGALQLIQLFDNSPQLLKLNLSLNWLPTNVCGNEKPIQPETINYLNLKSAERIKGAFIFKNTRQNSYQPMHLFAKKLEEKQVHTNQRNKIILKSFLCK